MWASVRCRSNDVELFWLQFLEGGRTHVSWAMLYCFSQHLAKYSFLCYLLIRIVRRSIVRHVRSSQSQALYFSRISFAVRHFTKQLNVNEAVLNINRSAQKQLIQMYYPLYFHKDVSWVYLTNVMHAKASLTFARWQRHALSLLVYLYYVSSKYSSNGKFRIPFGPFQVPVLFTADNNLWIQVVLNLFWDLTAFTPLIDSMAATDYIYRASINYWVR